MYARVARFVEIDPSRVDAQVAEMQQQMRAARAGELPDDLSEQARTLVETVKRFVYLVDRETGTGLGISFTATDEDMRRADAAMNEMSPGTGDGRRTDVEIYEVVLDEAFD
jgi:hypothetical protein